MLVLFDTNGTSQFLKKMFKMTLIIVGNADLTSAKYTQRDLWCIKDGMLDSFMVSGESSICSLSLLVEKFPMMTLTISKTLMEVGVKKKHEVSAVYMRSSITTTLILLLEKMIACLSLQLTKQYTLNNICTTHIIKQTSHTLLTNLNKHTHWYQNAQQK